MTKILIIKVIPSSNKNQIIEGKPLIVKVKESPIKGRANKAVVKLLTKYFGKRIRESCETLEDIINISILII